MKKFLATVAAIFLFAVGINIPFSILAQEQSVPLPPDPTIRKSIVFDGKLNRTVTLIPNGGGTPQEILNMRRPRPGLAYGWRVRGGSTKFNTTAIAAAQVKGLWSYTNPQTGTQYFLAQCNDAIYSASNIPPNTGTTFGTSVYSLSSNTPAGFADEINDDWVFAASGETPIAWSGGTAYPDLFKVNHDLTASPPVYDDGYDRIRNDDTAKYITLVEDINTAEAMYVGYRRRLKGVTINLVSGSENTVTATMSVYAYRNGSWTAVSNLSDGTASGGVTLAQSGQVTWDYSSSDDPYILPGTRDHLFIYKIVVSADIDDDVQAYEIKVHDDPEAMTNLWSGLFDPVLGCLLSTTAGYDDFTPEVTDGTDVEYVDVGGLTTSHALYVGFATRVMGLIFKIDADNCNEDTAATVTVSYWDGASSAWTAVNASLVTDGTKSGTYSLNKTGFIQWDATEFTEDKRLLGGISTPLYWYKLTWSADLPSDIHIWEIGGAEKPENYNSFPSYDGVIEYNGRALWWPGKDYKAGVDFSHGGKPFGGLPHVLNGPTAGTTGDIFGPGTVNAVARLHSYAIVSTKEPYRLYVLEGKVKGKWDELLISSNVGAVAPHTLITIEDTINLFSQNIGVHAVILLAPDGVYLTDGRVVTNISEPIADYWDTSSEPYIEPSYANISYAWVDYDERTVHIAVPMNLTGTGTQTTCNRELVYCYANNEWYDTYKRGSAAACGLSMVGSNDRKLSLVGDYSGYVYLTGDAYTDDAGTIIEHYVKTSDFMPLFGVQGDYLNFAARLRAVKIIAKAASTGSIEVKCYPDGATSAQSLSATGNNTFSLTHSGYNYVTGKLGANRLGETFSLRFRSGVSQTGAKMEIYGYTIDVQPVRETQVQ